MVANATSLLLGRATNYLKLVAHIATNFLPDVRTLILILWIFLTLAPSALGYTSIDNSNLTMKHTFCLVYAIVVQYVKG